MRAAIPPYLRSLWNLNAPLYDIAPPHASQPFLSPLGMHLPLAAPEGSSARWFEAAAAHAATHLVFSRHRFDATRVGPVTQAVLGVLEDARVEWLACRELPGLRRLWLPFHAEARSDTPDFEELLRRLARCLLDPGCVDPHPWVRKARRLFFLDEAGDTLAMPQAASLLHAASLLGNDIGQMRLQFNARLYRVAPCYRDDNSYLWHADPTRADSLQDIAGSGPDRSNTAAQAHVRPAALVRYAEWDRLIPGYRPDWCAVFDAAAPAAPALAVMAPLYPGLPSVVAGPPARLRCQFDGDEFDLDALVAACTDRRSGHTPRPRVYLRRRRQPDPGATVLLIDASASSAQACEGADTTILSHACLIALHCARSILQAGGACAIHSFCSDTRHAVYYDRIKDFDEPLDAAAYARLMGVQSRLSTRLGAALRHATHLLGSVAGVNLRVLLLTDGRPRDIDIHDSRYLVEDARQAVRSAMREQVLAQCLALDRSALGTLERIFGIGQVADVPGLAALPAALNRLASNVRR